MGRRANLRFIALSRTPAEAARPRTRAQCIACYARGKRLQSGRHLQCVLALMLNKQEIDTQSTAIPIKQMV